ncbi:hypothetical protein [Stenotrophobium rhamnosiphilum]|nr:hypothetical protein [Stenotrophobium rhamnosiphilum]
MHLKIRPQAYLLGLFIVLSLSGCVKGCYQSDSYALTQTPAVDPSVPTVTLAKFPFNAKVDASWCQTASPVRVELFVDVSGYVQRVTVLDPWPDACAKEYLRGMNNFKFVESPLTQPIEKLIVNLQVSRTSRRQCMKLQN